LNPRYAGFPALDRSRRQSSPMGHICLLETSGALDEASEGPAPCRHTVLDHDPTIHRRRRGNYLSLIYLSLVIFEGSLLELCFMGQVSPCKLNTKLKAECQEHSPTICRNGEPDLLSNINTARILSTHYDKMMR